MNIFQQVVHLLKSGISTGGYYDAMNNALKKISGDYTMLHYPLHVKDTDDFPRAQENLTRYCLSFIEPIKGKKVLEVGCGNGVQTKFIHEHYQPGTITGLDLNDGNIRIANQEKERRQFYTIQFLVDNAQDMKNIPDNSFDVVVNIESAFHYPDKTAFLKELKRVLVPGGTYLIADILTTRKKYEGYRAGWNSKMILHHWTLNQYISGIEKAGLELVRQEDITSGVIRGFRNYPYWLRKINISGRLRQLAFKTFYFINIRLNIYLLQTRRQYYIFSGIKPHSS
jgi:2-polyprenyl-3-methyl-5-hydroxy-6-metoxy-1,4-benzoquinol methylase